MSLASETSHLIEQVSAELVDDSGFMTVEILDSQGGGVVTEKNIKIDNPFHFDYSRFLSNCQVMDLPRFIEIADAVIQDAQEREDTVSKEQVKLVQEYPKERMDRLGEEVIAWKLVSRRPANMSTKATDRPQRSFGYYYRLRNPKYPNKSLTVETRPLDHIIEFQCWAKNARLANRRALWLERLFVSHAWAFKVQGADRFYFESRSSDWYTMHGGQELYVRPVRFFVRLRDFRVTAQSIIQHITLEVGSTTSSEILKGF